MWTSSYRNNTTLQHTYSNSIRKDGSRIPVYIFYTVVNSEQFTGVAQMTSDVEFAKSFNYWWEDGKWTGVTKIKWVYIKDAPHNLFNHVIEGDKPVTVLRDGTRLSYETGLKMLRVFENLPTGNSEDIFDAFPFMDDREEKMRLQRDFVGTNPDNNKPYQSSGNKHYKSDNQYYKGPKPTSSYKGGQGGNNGYVSKYPYKKDFQKGSKDYQYEKESDQKNEDGNFGIVIQKKSTKSKKGRANGKADEQEPKQDSKGEAKDNIVEVPPSED